MKNKALLLLIALLYTHFSFACLNEIRVLLDGTTRASDDPVLLPHSLNTEEQRKKTEKKLNELDSLWHAEKKIDDYSDYGVMLVYLGKYQEALKVFQNIEIVIPGLYTTAANMGTTYELLGENNLAYKWIKKAIEIDSTSHDYSEWLHLRILDVKMKGDKYLNSNFLIDATFGDDSIPKSDLPVQKLETLRDAIYYQLNERVKFVKPKEPIVALLLFELGNICAITDDATSAFRIYEMAQTYGYSSETFDKRFEFVSGLQRKIDNPKKREATNHSKHMHRSQGLSMLIISCTFILCLLAGFFVWRKTKKNKTSSK